MAAVFIPSRMSAGRYAEAVGLSPDGKTLAIKDDKFLYFRDAATGKELRKIKYLTDSGGGRSLTDWLTFTPDGKQIAATLMGNAIHLIDVETGKVKRTFDRRAAASRLRLLPRRQADGDRRVRPGEGCLLRPAMGGRHGERTTALCDRARSQPERHQTSARVLARRDDARRRRLGRRSAPSLGGRPPARS